MRKGIFAAIAVLAFAGSASAYTYKTIYTFCTGTGACSDGNSPMGVALDGQGNLYGATAGGGKSMQSGVIYELIPNADKTAWSYVKLYEFCRNTPCNNGNRPDGKVVIDTAGNLYGTTDDGGLGGGTVFELMPNGDRSQWTLTTLYRFCSVANCTDGKFPESGLTYVGQSAGTPYDGVSPLYGTASNGGTHNVGVAFELTRHGARYHESVIHDFCTTDCADGSYPFAGLTADAGGNLYGTTQTGGVHEDQQGHGGTVFELSPGPHGSWTETTLYAFNALANGADGYVPDAEVLLDGSGNIYGTTIMGGTNQQGGVTFKLTPGTPWQETVLDNFCSASNCADGRFPNTGLLSSGGSLIGMTQLGGVGHRGPLHEGAGNIYAWDGSTTQVIHNFCQNHHCADGALPAGTLVQDGSGIIYGTASAGGDNHKLHSGAGVVFALVP